MSAFQSGVLCHALIGLAIVSKVLANNASLCDTCSCDSSSVICENIMLEFAMFSEHNGSMFKSIHIIGVQEGAFNESWFQNFENISELQLESNNITIGNTTFHSLLNLVKLHLRNNSIENLTSSMFETNQKIQKVDLTKNLIHVVENGTFKNLTNLLSLNMSDNHITDIGSLGFAGGQSMVELDLSENLLRILKIDVFAPLRNLQVLILRSNRLEELPVGVFGAAPLLRELDLRSNRLRHLDAHAFVSTPALKVLLLSENLLETAEDDAWAGLEALEELDLSGNRLLRAQPEASALAALRRLRVLRLGGNRISSLAPALVEMLAQRPDLSAQLSPNPLRCTCDALELRAAWRAETARGLRLSLTCASGRPWDEQLRGLNCEGTDAKATEKKLNDTTTGGIATESSTVALVPSKTIEVEFTIEEESTHNEQCDSKYIVMVCVVILAAVCLVIVKIVYIFNKDVRKQEEANKKLWTTLTASTDEKKRLWSSTSTGCGEYRDNV